jgi:hypothetical protein
MCEAARERYWGVLCHQCSDKIGLARVRYDEETGKMLPPTLRATQFLADCPHGHSRDMYLESELIDFEGPALLEFPTHPDFR